jgi:hypothetical protein
MRLLAQEVALKSRRQIIILLMSFFSRDFYGQGLPLKMTYERIVLIL